MNVHNVIYNLFDYYEIWNWDYNNLLNSFRVPVLVLLFYIFYKYSEPKNDMVEIWSLKNKIGVLSEKLINNKDKMKEQFNQLEKKVNDTKTLQELYLENMETLQELFLEKMESIEKDTNFRFDMHNAQNNEIRKALKQLHDKIQTIEELCAESENEFVLQ
jgi:hypothetical protein